MQVLSSHTLPNLVCLADIGIALIVSRVLSLMQRVKLLPTDSCDEQKSGRSPF